MTQADEHKSSVVGGRKPTFQDPRVKSVLIELNENLADDMAIIEMLFSLGLLYRSK